MNTAGFHPGDVLCVNTRTFWGRIIRLGSWLSRTGGRTDHIVVVSHVDKADVMWGIEGRPGGAGWVDLDAAPYVLVSTNAGQVKNISQRMEITRVLEGLIERPYAWSQIVMDAMHAIGAARLWRLREWGNESPAQVVCSSLADWAYEHVGLATPRADQYVTPADWDVFNRNRAWE